jgi:hypothetical protein
MRARQDNQMVFRSVLNVRSAQWADKFAAVSTAEDLSRRDFLGGLLILGCANGLSSRIIEVVRSVGWATALVSTFGVSVIVWISCCAGLALVLGGRSGRANAADFAAGAAFLLLVALPISSLSWVAVAGLCIYILATTNCPSTRQGAFILLATSVPMLWSRLLFKFFATPILNADAFLVGLMLGTKRSGNMIEFTDHSGELVVLAPCSSLANVSLAILCWVTISELAAHKRSTGDIFWCFLACASVVAVNVSRMAMMGISTSAYNTVHSDFGGAITSLIITAITISICLLGTRRELFADI